MQLYATLCKLKFNKATLSLACAIIPGFVFGQSNNGGSSRVVDWDFGTSQIPTHYILHTKSWIKDPVTDAPTLEETTVDYSGQALSNLPWAVNSSGEEHSSFQEVHVTYDYKLRWNRTDKPAPEFVYLTIRADANANATPSHYGWTADNGIGSPVIMLSSEEGIDCKGVKTYKVPVVGGVAEKELSLSSSATGASVLTTVLGTYNTARAQAGASAEVKGVKIVYEQSQTFFKGSNGVKSPNDETSVSDAKIDTGSYRPNNSGSTAIFGGTFSAVKEGDWVDPYHVWIDMGGNQRTDSFFAELESIMDGAFIPIDASFVQSGVTKQITLSVTNKDPLDTLTISFPLKVVIHMPEEAPTVFHTDVDYETIRPPVKKSGPLGQRGGGQIITFDEQNVLWDVFGYLAVGVHVIEELRHMPVVAAYAIAVHYALEAFAPHEILDQNENYRECWWENESTWDGSTVRPQPDITDPWAINIGHPEWGISDHYLMNAGVVAFYNRDTIHADGYDAHGYTGTVSSFAKVWHREHGFGAYASNGGGGVGGQGGQNNG